MLRGVSDWRRFTIAATDGNLGRVADLCFDDRDLLVDTTNKWAGKRVLVAPEWLTHASWDASKTFFCIATAVCDGPGHGTTRLRPARP